MQKHGVLHEAAGQYDMPPLHWAACNAHLLVVHYLIEVCAGLFSLCMLDWRRVILGTQQSLPHTNHCTLQNQGVQCKLVCEDGFVPGPMAAFKYALHFDRLHVAYYLKKKKRIEEKGRAREQRARLAEQEWPSSEDIY